MKYRLAAVAAVAGLSLAGCGSVAGADHVAAKASAAVAAQAMSVQEAGQTYLKLSAPSNAAREAWMSAPAPTKANLAKHKRLAAKAADATATFAKGLRAHRWPSQAQPFVTALDKQLKEREAAYRRVAGARTVAEYVKAAGQVPVTTGLTGAVRKALGLPEGAVVTGATPRGTTSR